MDYHYAIYKDLSEFFLSYFNEKHNRTPEGELLDYSGRETKPKVQNSLYSEKNPTCIDIDMSDMVRILKLIRNKLEIVRP